MVLTITVVGGNGSGGNGGAGGQPSTPTPNSQELHTVLSPNDLAQLMSGQTVTGLLNPDGSITLNSNLMPAQQHPHHHHHHQMDSSSSIPNTIGVQQHNGMPTSNSIAATTLGSANSYQYCRNVKFEPNIIQTNSLSNMQAIVTGDPSNNNNDNVLSNTGQMNSFGHSQQQQQSQPQQPQPAQQVKKTGQKRLTAKQKQALQQQQQQQQQQIQQQQLDSMQSSASRQQLQHQHQQQQQQMQISQNPDQSGMRAQQPQVVATVQLPNGQIGQLIAPSGGFWSPNALDLQQLSMAVAAATGTMPQTLSLPVSAAQSQSVAMGVNNQQHMQMTHQQQAQVPHSSSQHANQALGDPLLQSPSITVTSSAQNTLPIIHRGNQQFHSANLQLSQQQQQQQSLQISMPQQQTSSQPTSQGLAIASPRDESTPTPTSGQSQGGLNNKKLKRLACTCPNCRDGDNNRGSGDKKKQHICHFPDCNKVYGKTSHLRAHLRWHSGERPYICSWSFCGKKFTRSDELQRHRRTHTGEKRFQCQECLKRFMRSDHLSKHLKTHLAGKKCTPQQPSPLLNSTQTF